MGMFSEGDSAVYIGGDPYVFEDIPNETLGTVEEVHDIDDTSLYRIRFGDGTVCILGEDYLMGTALF